VVNFVPVFNDTSGKWECPAVQLDPEINQPIDPWTPTFDIPGVSSIFKRFYFNHCHLQVLFNTTKGDDIMKHYQEKRNSIVLDDMSVSFAVEQQQKYNLTKLELDAYPLTILLDITKKILRYPPKNTDQLLQIIQRKSDGHLDLTLWNVVLNKAKQNYQIVHNNSETGLPNQIVLLRGDAVSTAHFRLGVGVNNAFMSYGELLTGYLLKTESLEQLLLQQENRWSKLIRYMASTMFWESYCDHVVFFNTEATTDYSSNGDDHLATVWERDNKQRTFYQFDSISELLNSCTNYYRV
jgi:hypothetical protein